ncbi:hypothetical protein RCKICKAPOO_76 [Rhodobacter phage RcKickapoo]|nr:hypothetical protein RCKICKAPOO_76 [Rhodobacter phage RcKickapoo]
MSDNIVTLVPRSTTTPVFNPGDHDKDSMVDEVIMTAVESGYLPEVYDGTMFVPDEIPMSLNMRYATRLTENEQRMWCAARVTDTNLDKFYAAELQRIDDVMRAPGGWTEIGVPEQFIANPQQLSMLRMADHYAFVNAIVPQHAAGFLKAKMAASILTNLTFMAVRSRLPVYGVPLFIGSNYEVFTAPN